MRPLDLQVMDSALQWVLNGHTVWLCTVLEVGSRLDERTAPAFSLPTAP